MCNENVYIEKAVKIMNHDNSTLLEFAVLEILL